MPLASQERVEGVYRFGRDSVAIGSGRCRRLGRNRSRLVAIGRDSVAPMPTIRSRFGRDSVAIGRENATSFWRFVAIGRNRSRLRRDDADCVGTMPTIGSGRCRLRRDDADCVGTMPIASGRCRHPRRKHKKTRFLEGIGLRVSACVACLVNRLIPHVNKRASARIVLRVQARQWYIVMPMSARRHIGRYI